MPKQYYFVSDLHIGGDEALGVCDFQDELIAFVDGIASREEDAELIIIGDAFGLWEFTGVEGAEKIEKLIGQFPEIFEAFRRAGEKIKITVLPGNHDYELACYPEFVDIFKAFNIVLEQTPAITRKIGDKKLWIEHGNQYDTTNRMPDYGSPHAMPIGYFITSNMVGKAGQISEQGRFNWLKDIQSVYPTELIPDWILSNYFYREMSPVLRWVLLPFLLLSGVTLFVLGGAALEYFKITDDNIFLNNRIFDALGVVGSLLQIILTINAIALLVFLALAIPVGFVLRDLKKTMKRFDIEMDPAKLTGSKNNSYTEAATKIFENDTGIIAFIYGHTHTPSIKQEGDRYVINTGTWLKRFERVSPRFGLLPAIYVPHYNLNYFCLITEKGQIVIEYHKTDKPATSALSLLQRMMVSRRRRKKAAPIPSKTLVGLS
ncbi:MAG: metallophosphoesterase [Bacteroidales bacterium]|nr:metallophosphoesterase [Bacteroidales bacterium]